MIALYGGTFNPVHIGHLHVASVVRERLGLDEVRMVLSARPPHRDQVPVEHRWQMLQLACTEAAGIHADDREMRRKAASYTVQTLLAERRRQPFTPVYWVMGMDSLLTFRSWHQWWRILDLAHLVVVKRPGYRLQLDPLLRSIVARRQFVPATSARRRTRQPAGVAGRIVLLEEPMLSVSSSAIRQRLREHGGTATQVVPAVAAYIKQHRLYESVP